MTWRSLLLLGGALCCSPALADVIHLRNGRSLEGEVVRRTEESVTLKIGGGQMVLPASEVTRIEGRATPAEDYAALAARTDMSDPAAVDRLSLWASQRGLGLQARHLAELAKGLRLERRVLALRAGDARPGHWLDLYRWCRSQSFSSEVLEWVLEQALALDPEEPEALAAWDALQEPEAPPPPPAARPVSAREVEDLEARLATQQARIAQLQAEQRRLEAEQERLEDEQDRLRRRRVVIRRRHGRGGPGLIVATPEPVPSPFAEPPPPPPVSIRGR